MSSADKIDDITARVAISEAAIEKLQAGQERIEEILLRITARLPAPPQPPPPAPNLHPNTGLHYNGEPSPSETASYGETWAKKHADGSVTIPGQGFGVRHTAEGRAILPGAEHEPPRPIGPDRSPEHDMAVRLLDAGLDREP
jgi:hypothetical protein